MIEPFLYLINRPLDPGLYFEEAPVIFKDPNKKLYAVPMTSRVLAGDRDFYSESEIAADKQFLAAARTNSRKGQIRKNADNDFVSVRSSQGEVPCAIIFVLETRAKAFEKIAIDPGKYYIIFITADEVLFAEKAKYKPAQIRKTLANIKNKLASTYPNASPLLSSAIFEYDEKEARYVEV